MSEGGGEGGGRGTGEGEKLLSHSDIRKLTDKTRSKLDLFAFRLQALRIFPEGRKVEWGEGGIHYFFASSSLRSIEQLSENINQKIFSGNFCLRLDFNGKRNNGIRNVFLM